MTRCRPFIVAGIVGLLTGWGYWGCEEREVFVQDDEDEIRAYLTMTEEGRELFRTDNLIPAGAYTLPLGDTAYQDIVDSVWRSVSIVIDSLPREIGIPGEYFVATVWVADRFFVRTLKTAGDSTVVVFGERPIDRIAYFAKLGDDRKPFLGWRLWAFNGIGQYDPPVNLRVRTVDGSQVLAATLSNYGFHPLGTDIYFIRLTDISALSHGTELSVKATPWAGRPSSYYHLISYESSDGFIIESLDEVNPSLWVDTLVTPSPNKRLWNLICVQTFLDPPNSQFQHGWCIPYRVPQ